MKSVFLLCSFLIAVNGLVAQKGDATTQAESRKSTRSNSDKCNPCPPISFIITQGTSSTDLGVFDLFDQSTPSGYVYVDMLVDGNAVTIKDYVSFSSDDTKLTILMSKLCPPKCPKKLTLTFIKEIKRCRINSL